MPLSSFVRLFTVAAGLCFCWLTLPNLLAATPSIAQPPVSAAVVAHTNHTLSVSADGSNLTYQWRKFGAPIAGATLSTLQLSDAADTDSGFYDVAVADETGTTTSVAARITVVPASYADSYRRKAGFSPRFESLGGVTGVIRMTDGGFYLFGNLARAAGHETNGVGKFLPDGSVDSSFIGSSLNGFINAAAVQPDGAVVVGGTFYLAANISRNYIARLTSNGALDTSFDPAEGFNAAVHAIALQNDGKIIVGGQFTTFNGVACKSLARLNADGSLDTGFSVGAGVNGIVYKAVVLPDGKILIGGSFISVNNVSRFRIARLNPDGSLDTSFGTANFGLNNTVYSLARQSDGKIIAGGAFTGFGNATTTPESRIARLNSDGSLDTSFNVAGSGIDGIVNSVSVRANGEILAGGSFHSYDGAPADLVVQLNSDGTRDASFNPALAATGAVGEIAELTDGRICVAGGLYDPVTFQCGAFLLSATGSVDASFAPALRSAGGVSDVAILPDGRWLVAGDFVFVNDTVCASVARLLGDGSVDPSFHPGATFFGSGRNIVLQSDGRAVLAGKFYDPALDPIVRLDSSGAIDSSFELGVTTDLLGSPLQQMPDGTLGVVLRKAGTSWYVWAHLNPDGALIDPLSSGNGFTATAPKLALQHTGQVIAVGSFITYDGEAANRIVRLNTDGSRDSSFNFGTGFNSTTVSPVIAGLTDQLWVSGLFTSYNGTSRAGLVKLTADGAVDPTFSPGTGFSGYGWAVTMAAQADDKLLISGNYLTYNGSPTPALTRLLADGSLDSSFYVSNYVAGIPAVIRHLANGELLLAGGRLDFSDGAVYGMTLLEPISDTPPVITTPPASATLVAGSPANLTVAATGAGPLTYQWKKNTVAIAGATNATYTIASTTTGDAGSYTVEVTNPYGTTTSAAASLTIATTPAFTTQPASTAVLAGQGVTLTAAGSGTPAPTYQWYKNDVAIAGATNATYTLATTTAADAGSYTVKITNAAGTTTSAAALLTVNPGTYLSNLSVRASMAAAQNLIVGFVVNGGSKPIFVRAAGPALNDTFKLTGYLADPQLTLYAASGATLATNNDWDSALASTAATLGAFPFVPDSKDAAILQTLTGPNTAHAPASTAGTQLVEVYDAGANNGVKLVNVSARNHVGTSNDILIAGFVIAGAGKHTVLIRAIGPGLIRKFGLQGVLADPKLTLYTVAGAPVTSNDDWEATLATTFDTLGAFDLGPGSKDAALLVELDAGVYTAQVAGADGGQGEALVEIYDATP